LWFRMGRHCICRALVRPAPAYPKLERMTGGDLYRVPFALRPAKPDWLLPTSSQTPAAPKFSARESQYLLTAKWLYLFRLFSALRYDPAARSSRRCLLLQFQWGLV